MTKTVTEVNLTGTNESLRQLLRKCLWPTVAYVLLLGVAAFTGFVNWQNLLVGFGLLAACVVLLWLLMKFWGRRLVIVAILLMAAVNSYMCIGLISMSKILWISVETPMIHLVGYAWVLAIYLVSYVLVGRVRPAVILGSVILMLFAVVSYMLMAFRGRPLLASDLYSLGVAMSVAGQYEFPFELPLFLGLILWISGISVCWSLAGAAPMGSSRPKLWMRLCARGVALFLALLYVFCFYGTYMLAHSGLWLTWNENDFSTSPLTYFMYSFKEMYRAAPDGYDQEHLEEVLDGIEARPAASEEQPHVIAIMSESFSDLATTYGFDTSVEHIPYFRELWENSIHGWAYASIFGANTANSEYEFLTGNSLAFEGSSTVPYQMDINYEKDTLVSILKAQGYTTKALHPYGASGWNRVQVYDLFDFDETYFIDDWVNPKKIRGYISDESNFQKLIELFEEREEGEKLFLFNITMQNHGGYKNENYQTTVTIPGHEGEFPLAEQYLSLLQDTDEATRMLIEYFESVDEPVILVIFGDHQPKLGDEFYDFAFGEPQEERDLLEQQKQYEVPVLIWKNYEDDSEDLGHTSLNYLGQLTLEEAGLGTSAFGSWLMDLREDYPTINAYGYTDSEGNWESMPGNLEELPDRLRDYRILQYNFLHDTTGYRSDIFAFDAEK